MPIESDPLSALKNLEPRAITQVHERYLPELYRYARYRLGSDQLAEDAASEAFLRLLDALERGKGPRRNVRGWLFSTVSHIVDDHFRARYAHPAQSLEEAGDDIAQSRKPPMDPGELDPDLQVAMETLTRDQKYALQLRFGAELNLEETALVMGRSVEAVKSLQYRAISTLRSLLQGGDG